MSGSIPVPANNTAPVLPSLACLLRCSVWSGLFGGGETEARGGGKHSLIPKFPR